MVAALSRAEIDQVLGEHADDAVAAGVELADVAPRPSAVSMTPQAEALMTAETPPDWA